MTLKSLTFYGFILLMGGFLYLPVIFSYGLLAPVHVLIVWLMHDRFLLTLKSNVFLGKLTYAIIPSLMQNLLLFVYFISTADWSMASMGELYFSWIGLILAFVTIAELFILQSVYSKFLGKHHRA